PSRAITPGGSGSPCWSVRGLSAEGALAFAGSGCDEPDPANATRHPAARSATVRRADGVVMLLFSCAGPRPAARLALAHPAERLGRLARQPGSGLAAGQRR